MKATYNEETDMMYVYLREEGDIEKTIAGASIFNERYVFDVGEDGDILGIEIFSPSEIMTVDDHKNMKGIGVDYYKDTDTLYLDLMKDSDGEETWSDLPFLNENYALDVKDSEIVGIEVEGASKRVDLGFRKGVKKDGDV